MAPRAIKGVTTADAPRGRGGQGRVPQSSRKPQINHVVSVPRAGHPVTYFLSAPHPPSERQTDAGRLPPWLPGVAVSARGS
ncbi:hypothetical protein GCM10010324_45230 [Streptomyces hiroshimensis]|uniref:Transposase n=1 Tax=Streptomyces hiroshimensis TaxID=66424 RepID=A0ABQ2YSZ6_9ACTN|nr:hypothetical protein GCM10010324_45230 [Streptomyces hiroshimensis]